MHAQVQRDLISTAEAQVPPAQPSRAPASQQTTRLLRQNGVSEEAAFLSFFHTLVLLPCE